MVMLYIKAGCYAHPAFFVILFAKSKKNTTFAAK